MFLAAFYFLVNELKLLVNVIFVSNIQLIVELNKLANYCNHDFS